MLGAAAAALRSVGRKDFIIWTVRVCSARARVRPQRMWVCHVSWSLRVTGLEREESTKLYQPSHARGYVLECAAGKPSHICFYALHFFECSQRSSCSDRSRTRSLLSHYTPFCVVVLRFFLTHTHTRAHLTRTQRRTVHSHVNKHQLCIQILLGRRSLDLGCRRTGSECSLGRRSAGSEYTCRTAAGCGRRSR